MKNVWNPSTPSRGVNKCMKLADLNLARALHEKGPIIGAPKGSQKDARMGTDDPAKYMRGGEWEAYREPQGVNSNAGKIAGGKKKGTTRTKNKKMSESVNDLMASAFWFNPYTDQTVPEQKWTTPRAQNGSHAMAAVADLDLDFPPGTEVSTENEQQILANAFEHGWIRGLNMDGHVVLQGGSKSHAKDAFRAVRPSMQALARAGASNKVTIGSTDGFSHSYVVESIQPSGAGDSNDMVARDGVGITMDLVVDTNKQNKGRHKMPGSEAPTKKVVKQVKKSLDNRPGNVSDINEAVEQILNEAIPRVMPRDYTADYELLDDKSEDVIGVAKIEHGVIEVLSVRNDLAEDFEGHIMSRLLSTIVRDADLADANLAIAMDNPGNLGQKRFLERFGFRETGGGILKRNAGSVTPPSVLTARL